MNITVDISEGELDALDLTPRQLEELVWENLGDNIDPSEILDAAVIINVYE